MIREPLYETLRRMGVAPVQVAIPLAKRYKPSLLHWSGAERCPQRINPGSPSVMRRIVDGAEFNETPETLRCSRCAREFNNA